MFVHVTNCIPIDYEYNMNIFLFRIKRCHKRKLIIVLLLVVHCFHFWSCPLFYHKQLYWHVGMEELQVPERYIYINIIVYIPYCTGMGIHVCPPAPNILHENSGPKPGGHFHHTIFGIDDVT